MDQTAREIEAHIDQTRERLGSHLRELEDKVEAATNWRRYYREKPYLFLGAAFIGAALIATALRGRSDRDDEGEEGLPFSDRHEPAKAQVRDVLNNVKYALIGVASAKVKEYIAELVPGFDEHYQRAQEKAFPSQR